jgi:D-ribose pyranose/furanose isomerase RbsD
MKSSKYAIVVALLICIVQSCKPKPIETNTTTAIEWKTALKSQLSALGHRNWILIVDKAFPAQHAEGIVTIDTHEDLLKVVDYTMQQIDTSTHVKPIVYTDRELSYITKKQVPTINDYRKLLTEIIGKNQPKMIMHDSVFLKIDEASKLFNILVLKTNEVIPYSSVFIQLDCKYWTSEKEKQLRESMKQGMK